MIFISFYIVINYYIIIYNYMLLSIQFCQPNKKKKSKGASHIYYYFLLFRTLNHTQKKWMFKNKTLKVTLNFYQPLMITVNDSDLIKDNNNDYVYMDISNPILIRLRQLPCKQRFLITLIRLKS